MTGNSWLQPVCPPLSKASFLSRSFDAPSSECVVSPPLLSFLLETAAHLGVDAPVQTLLSGTLHHAPAW